MDHHQWSCQEVCGINVWLVMFSVLGEMFLFSFPSGLEFFLVLINIFHMPKTITRKRAIFLA